MPAPVRTFAVRHVQLLRALFAAIAALMIAFSSDHSAQVGLAVFGGFVGTTALVLILGAWLAVPKGARWSLVLIAVIDIVASMLAGIPAWRTDTFFFVLVIVWAAVTGLIEFLSGLRVRRTQTGKDAVTVGVFGLLLAVVLLLVPVGFTWDYTIENAGTRTLTGIIVAVGVLGTYLAIVAVFLAIAGFSPRRVDGRTEASGQSDDTTASTHIDPLAAAVSPGGAA